MHSWIWVMKHTQLFELKNLREGMNFSIFKGVISFKFSACWLHTCSLKWECSELARSECLVGKGVSHPARWYACWQDDTKRMYWLNDWQDDWWEVWKNSDWSEWVGWLVKLKRELDQCSGGICRCFCEVLGAGPVGIVLTCHWGKIERKHSLNQARRLFFFLSFCFWISEWSLFGSYVCVYTS